VEWQGALKKGERAGKQTMWGKSRSTSIVDGRLPQKPEARQKKKSTKSPESQKGADEKTFWRCVGKSEGEQNADHLTIFNPSETRRVSGNRRDIEKNVDERQRAIHQERTKWKKRKLRAVKG